MNPYSAETTKLVASSGITYREVGVGRYRFSQYCNYPPSFQGWVEAVDKDGKVVYSQAFTPSFRADVDYQVPLYHGFVFNGVTGTAVPTVDTDNMETRVYTDLMAKVSSSDFDLSTNIAELGETIDMFRSMIPKLVDDVLTLKRIYVNIPKRAFKRGLSRRQFEKMLKELPNQVSQYWLTYRYGILPFKHAVDDYLAAIARRDVMFETVRAGDSEILDLGPEWEPGAVVKAHGVWKGRFTNTSKKRTSLYLPTTAYELIPFSFVADWFVNLGDLIAASRSIPTANANSCISVKTEIDSHRIKKLSLSPTTSIPLSCTFEYGRFYPDAEAHNMNFKITQRATTTVSSVYRSDLKIAHLKRDAIRRGAGSMGFAWNVDLSLVQKLDAVALLWVTQSKRIRF